MDYATDFHQFLSNLDAKTDCHNLIEAIREGYNITHPLYEGKITDWIVDKSKRLGTGIIVPLIYLASPFIVCSLSDLIRQYRDNAEYSKQLIEFQQAIEDFNHVEFTVPEWLAKEFERIPGGRDMCECDDLVRFVANEITRETTDPILMRNATDEWIMNMADKYKSILWEQQNLESRLTNDLIEINRCLQSKDSDRCRRDAIIGGTIKKATADFKKRSQYLAQTVQSFIDDAYNFKGKPAVQIQNKSQYPRFSHAYRYYDPDPTK